MDVNPPTLLGSMKLLSNLVSSAKILYCPSDHRRGTGPCDDFSELTLKNISYSYVPNLVWSCSNMDTIVMLDRIYTTEEGDHWPQDGNHADIGGVVLFIGCKSLGTTLPIVVTNAPWASFKLRLPKALRDKDGRAVVLSP
jgi:hypothetical protein